MSATANGGTYPIDALSTLLYKGNSDVNFLIKDNGAGEGKIYSTEVKGVSSKEAFDAGVPANSTQATGAIFREEAYVATEGIAAPVGFTTVNKYTGEWSAGGAIHLGNNGNKTNLSAYSDVYFAIKVENATITVYDGVKYEGTGWVHVHLINKGNDV